MILLACAYRNPAEGVSRLERNGKPDDALPEAEQQDQTGAETGIPGAHAHAQRAEDHQREATARPQQNQRLLGSCRAPALAPIVSITVGQLAESAPWWPDCPDELENPAPKPGRAEKVTGNRKSRNPGSANVTTDDFVGTDE